MQLIQQLQLWNWKALDFRGKFFLTVANVLCIFLKPGLSISCKDRKQVSFKLSAYSCNDRRYSYFKEIFAIDMLTVLKPF